MTLIVEVNILEQTMTVSSYGVQLRKYFISSGKPGFETTKGKFKIEMRSKNYVSKKYGSKMPYAQFFNLQTGEAFHQTFEKIDGKPRSHGCIRMTERDAKEFWSLTENEKNVIVKIY